VHTTAAWGGDDGDDDKVKDKKNNELLELIRDLL